MANFMRKPGCWSKLWVTVTITFLAGLFSLVIWMFAKSFGVLIFFAIVGGSVAGTFWAVVAPVTTEIMGLVDLPSALSLTWLVLVLPTTFSEPIGLEIVAYNGGSYTGAILFTGIMYCAAACVLWAVRAWKIGDVEEKAAMAGKSAADVDPVAATGTASGSVPEGFKKSPFLKRLLMWQRV